LSAASFQAFVAILFSLCCMLAGDQLNPTLTEWTSRFKSAFGQNCNTIRIVWYRQL